MPTVVVWCRIVTVEDQGNREEHLMRIDEVAEFLRTSERYVRDLIARKVLRTVRLPESKTGKQRRYRFTYWCSVGAILKVTR